MDSPFVRKWLSILVIILLICAGAWGFLRWSDSQAMMVVMAGSKAQNLKGSYLELRDQSDSVGGHWLRTLNPLMKDVQGDLIWNNRLQRGVMRFLNLPNPRRGQRYHLWIYDSKASLAPPILGATLHRGSGKFERFVAIKAERPVIEPFKFLLTMSTAEEQPEDDAIMLMAQP